MRTRKSIPISWTSPPKCLAVRPWPNSWMILTIARLTQKLDDRPPVEEALEVGQLGVERRPLADDQGERRRASMPTLSGDERTG